MINKKSALLIIDMQNDFMEGGALEVANANELVVPINDLMKLDWGLIVASQDWHPQNHVSFASNHPGKKEFTPITLSDGSTQMLWPDHCVQNSHGAEMHALINRDAIKEFVLKGQNPQVDSYSAFFDNNDKGETQLDNILREYNIKDIYVVGVARDYCTEWSALDGKRIGYNVYFIFDLTRPVNPKSDERIRQELEEAQVNVIFTSDIRKND